MATYRILDFMLSNEINCEDNFPVPEYLEYLDHFKDQSFEFDGEVKSLFVQLTIPSNNRIANVSLYAHTIDELLSSPEGSMPREVGRLQLTLWRDKGPEIVQTY